MKLSFCSSLEVKWRMTKAGQINFLLNKSALPFHRDDAVITRTIKFIEKAMNLPNAEKPSPCQRSVATITPCVRHA